MILCTRLPTTPSIQGQRPGAEAMRQPDTILDINIQEDAELYESAPSYTMHF